MTLSDGYVKTNHFEMRQAQRALQDTDIQIALTHGEVFFQRGGDRVVFLGRKNIPAFVPPTRADKLNGLTVVLGDGNVLVTTFRNPNGRAAIRKVSHGVRTKLR